MITSSTGSKSIAHVGLELRNLRLDVGDAALNSFGTSLHPLDTLAQARQLAWHFRQ